MEVQELETLLNKIWFSIRGKFPNSFIYDAEWNRTKFRVRWDCLDMYWLDNISVTLMFSKIKWELLDWDSVSIQDIETWDNPWVFIMFHNFKK